MRVYCDSAFVDRGKGRVIHVAYLDHKTTRLYKYLLKNGIHDNNHAELDCVMTFAPHFLSAYHQFLGEHKESLTICTDSMFSIRQIEEAKLFEQAGVLVEHIPRMLNPVNPYVHLLVQEFRNKRYGILYDTIHTKRLA